MEDAVKTTHQKLLEIAGEVFSELGFRATTVREICRRANTNVAAINYHFGDKEKLYAELFKYIHSLEQCSMPTSTAETDTDTMSPDEALLTFMKSMFENMLSPGTFSWKGKLMARELIDPSPVLDFIIELWISPCWEQVKKISARVIEKDINSDETHMAASSVMAQCFFHKHAREVLTRLNPTFVYSPTQIDLLSRYLSAFALGGLKALKNI